MVLELGKGHCERYVAAVDDSLKLFQKAHANKGTLGKRFVVVVEWLIVLKE